MRAVWGAMPVVFGLLAGPALGQGGLAGAAESVRRAWLAHDVDAILAGSQGIVLQIPGAAPSGALGRAQAAELLRQYLRLAEERSLESVGVREIEPGRGFVELVRRFAVVGTSQQRQETVFLGFRNVEGRWLLTELRTAP